MWDPAQYLKFSGPRLRPILDLLGRIPELQPSSVLDLGCGTGAATAMIADRWPAADVVGVDRSPAMLDVARRSVARVSFHQADLVSWDPGRQFDVVFSNAVLHWLDHHDDLLSRLLEWVAPGGVLAVQMPRNFDEPSHAIVRRMLEEQPWADYYTGGRLPAVADPLHYSGLVGPLVAELDLWETIYHHRLQGADPVAEWIRGSYLRPVLEQLGRQADHFYADYARRVADAYRPIDGITVYPFRRLFFVGVKGT